MLFKKIFGVFTFVIGTLYLCSGYVLNSNSLATPSGEYNEEYKNNLNSKLQESIILIKRDVQKYNFDNFEKETVLPPYYFNPLNNYKNELHNSDNVNENEEQFQGNEKLNSIKNFKKRHIHELSTPFIKTGIMKDNDAIDNFDKNENDKFHSNTYEIKNEIEQNIFNPNSSESNSLNFDNEIKESLPIENNESNMSSENSSLSNDLIQNNNSETKYIVDTNTSSEDDRDSCDCGSVEENSSEDSEIDASTEDYYNEDTIHLKETNAYLYKGIFNDLLKNKLISFEEIIELKFETIQEKKLLKLSIMKNFLFFTKHKNINLLFFKYVKNEDILEFLDNKDIKTEISISDDKPLTFACYLLQVLADKFITKFIQNKIVVNNELSIETENYLNFIGLNKYFFDEKILNDKTYQDRLLNLILIKNFNDLFEITNNVDNSRLLYDSLNKKDFLFPLYKNNVLDNVALLQNDFIKHKIENEYEVLVCECIDFMFKNLMIDDLLYKILKEIFSCNN